MQKCLPRLGLPFKLSKNPRLMRENASPIHCIVLLRQQETMERTQGTPDINVCWIKGPLTQSGGRQGGVVCLVLTWNDRWFFGGCFRVRPAMFSILYPDLKATSGYSYQDAKTSLTFFKYWFEQQGRMK